MSGSGNPFYGKSHSQENKEKISKFFTGLMVGDKNPANLVEFLGLKLLEIETQ